MKRMAALLLGGWISLTAHADDDWEALQEEWRFVAREAQLLLEQTPEDDWWARASLAVLMHPYTGSLLEWERLAVSALRNQQPEQLRAAAVATPQGASTRLRQRLFEAWMADQPDNLAPALSHALLAGGNVLDRLGDVSRFERHDHALFATAERLSKALPEATPVPISFTYEDDGVAQASDMVWVSLMGMAAGNLSPLFSCLDRQVVGQLASQDQKSCLAIGQRLETSSTLLIDNQLGLAMQRLVHEAIGDQAAAQAGRQRSEQITHLISSVHPDVGHDREQLERWRAKLVKHGELGALRWLEENCDDFDSSASCLLASD